MAEIYVIADNGPNGRYIRNAATTERHARELAEMVTDEYVMTGYPAPSVQTIPDAETAQAEAEQVPELLTVYHLRKSATAWVNVEVYRIRERIEQ